MGHLYSTTSIKELYNFSLKLGLKLHWNHYSRNFPHFGLTTKAKKLQAQKLGAILVDCKKDFDLVKQCQGWAKIMFQEESARQNVFYYKSKGLMGQEILRIDFNKIKHLL